MQQSQLDFEFYEEDQVCSVRARLTESFIQYQETPISRDEVRQMIREEIARILPQLRGQQNIVVYVDNHTVTIRPDNRESNMYTPAGRAHSGISIPMVIERRLSPEFTPLAVNPSPAPHKPAIITEPQPAYTPSRPNVLQTPIPQRWQAPAQLTPAYLNPGTNLVNQPLLDRQAAAVWSSGPVATPAQNTYVPPEPYCFDKLTCAILGCFCDRSVPPVRGHGCGYLMLILLFLAPFYLLFWKTQYLYRRCMAVHAVETKIKMEPLKPVVIALETLLQIMISLGIETYG